MAIGPGAKVEVRNTEIPEGIAIIPITGSNVSFNNVLGNVTVDISVVNSNVSFNKIEGNTTSLPEVLL